MVCTQAEFFGQRFFFFFATLFLLGLLRLEDFVIVSFSCGLYSFKCDVVAFVDLELVAATLVIPTPTTVKVEVCVGKPAKETVLGVTTVEFARTTLPGSTSGDFLTTTKVRAYGDGVCCVISGEVNGD